MDHDRDGCASGGHPGCRAGWRGCRRCVSVSSALQRGMREAMWLAVQAVRLRQTPGSKLRRPKVPFVVPLSRLCGRWLSTPYCRIVRRSPVLDVLFSRTSKNSWTKLIGAAHWPKLWMLHVTTLSQGADFCGQHAQRQQPAPVLQRSSHICSSNQMLCHFKNSMQLKIEFDILIL